MNKIKLLEKNSEWYPISINSLDNHFWSLIQSNDFVSPNETYPIVKNLSYSLQYIEFIHKIMNDVNLTSVLWTQNVKSLVIQGASVIEAIFNYLVKANGYSNKTNWIKVKTLNTSEYELDGKVFKNEILIHKKLEDPTNTQMTFDQMAKKVESRKLLGESYPHYGKINALRKLRNKIHIHDSDHNLDTDWNNFNLSELKLVCLILHSVLTSELFAESDCLNKFTFLEDVLNKESN